MTIIVAYAAYNEREEKVKDIFWRELERTDEEVDLME